jgi:hypothetical protein
MPDFKEIKFDEAKHLSNSTYLIESKIDGCCMSWKNGELVSERGCVRNDRFPHIVKELKLLNCEIQGEIAIPFGNVLTLSRRENWTKAKFYAFNPLDIDDDPERKRRELEKLMGSGMGMNGRPNFKHITIPFQWKNFKNAWKWVQRHGVEGLVFKSLLGSTDYKLKDWKELKLKIVGHTPGKQKGAFQILNANGSISGVSGTSVAYVDKYKQLVAAGEEVWVEIEYLFLTADGVPFQPRLRKLDKKSEILWKKVG